MSAWHGVVAIAGLVLITFGTRGFFFFLERETPMPPWLDRGLRHAPLAALMAVVAPDVLLTPDGHLLDTWKDPRLFALAAATAWFWWRRTMLGVILTGLAVMFGLRQGLGW